MTPPSDDRLELRRTFDVPRTVLFDAWTRPDSVREWFAPGEMTVPFAEIDFREGGRYRIAMRNPDGSQYIVSGTYRKIVPAERLVFTWRWEGDPEETLVTITFDEREGRTEMVLRHERFASKESHDRHLDGWNGCIEKLGRMTAFTRGGKR